ncbi:MAG: hypothetical protein D6766_10815 [Verrucomicrobia bacterium]|nr:MAG: hypothetical protein D6766_10815 [Verrucomicrobiota bacterium]
MPVGEVVASPLRFRSPTYRAFLEGLENGSLPGRPRRRIVAAGDTLAGWRVLHPASEDRFSLADDGAMVLRGECRGVRVLLLSDLATAGQEALLARGAPLEAEVVVAGIPSRGEPLPAWLVERIRPRWVIWTDAAVPPPKHAGPELRGRLEAAGVRSVSISDVGAVTLEVRGERVELRSARAGVLDAWRIATTARPGLSPGGPDER